MHVMVSSAIILIAVVVATTIFVGAGFSQVEEIRAAFNANVRGYRQQLLSDIEIVNVARDPSNPTLYLWVKNTGPVSVRLTGASSYNASYWDLFLTYPDGTVVNPTYSTSGSTNTWSATIVNDRPETGRWERGETVQITVNLSTLPTGTYTVKLALPTGASDEETFTLEV
jgi:archaellum component FlaF (FlaF/FlaG flagellin family)